MIFLSSGKLRDGSSSGIAAIYLSFMERVADEFSHSWTAASQLSLTKEADWHRGLPKKRYGPRPVDTSTELSYRNLKSLLKVLKKKKEKKKTR